MIMVTGTEVCSLKRMWMPLNDVNIELNNGSILTLNKSVMMYEDDYIVIRQKKSKIKLHKDDIKNIKMKGR